MSQHTPDLSILIPNYNNGRGSSITGRDDLIGDLLRSLHETLRDDPTPFEVIACDDGSTDDSLPTLRDWSRRTWPDGRPFLRLIEQTHCGVLARTANLLSRRARGRILARLDGDVRCLTPHWASKLVEVFDAAPPRLGIIGPKQLRPDGRIHAFGDWIIHPNGYHHIAAGADRYAVRHAIEADHVMGCFYCCRREVFEELDGYDERILRGQTIDFGLRARLAGWAAFAVPQIEFIHAHGLRRPRATAADSREGVRRSIDVFRRKWGFSRIAPDLDEVRCRYAGTPLLWRPQWTCPEPADPPPPDPIPIDRSDWARYASDTQLQQQVNAIIALVVQVTRQLGVSGPVAQLDCGHGLTTHLLALQGLDALGIDRCRPHIDLARRCTSGQSYPSTPPRFEQQTDPRRLPLADGRVELLLILHALERHPNPVTLLAEARRVLRPGGAALIVAQRRRTLDTAPLDPTHPYRLDELLNQVAAVGGWELLADPKSDDPRRDIILPIRRTPDGATPIAASAPEQRTAPAQTAAPARAVSQPT